MHEDEKILLALGLVIGCVGVVSAADGVTITVNPESPKVDESVTLTALGVPTNTTKYEWKDDAVQSGEEVSRTHTFTSAGSHTVVVTAYNGTTAVGFTSTTVSVAAKEVTPVVSFTFTPTTGTAPLKVQFTSNSTDSPTSHAWDFGDGNISDISNPKHTFITAKTYTVKLTVENGSLSNSTTQNIIITPPTTATTTAPTTATPIVQPQNNTVSFSATPLKCYCSAYGVFHIEYHYS